MRNDAPAETIASDLAATTIQLLIELDLDGAPIAGTVQHKPDGRATTFDGWLQLTETIESIRRSAAADPVPDLTARADPKGSRKPR